MDQHQTSTFDIFSNIVSPDDNDELAEQITLLSARMNAATYQIIKLIAVFDYPDGWYGAGHDPVATDDNNGMWIIYATDIAQYFRHLFSYS